MCWRSTFKANSRNSTSKYYHLWRMRRKWGISLAIAHKSSNIIYTLMNKYGSKAQNSENPLILVFWNLICSTSKIILGDNTFSTSMGWRELPEIIEYWDKKTKEIKIRKAQLPNIVHLNEDGWKANIQLRTMIAMIKQEQTNKEGIMNQFYKLNTEAYN